MSCNLVKIALLLFVSTRDSVDVLFVDLQLWFNVDSWHIRCRHVKMGRYILLKINNGPRRLVA